MILFSSPPLPLLSFSLPSAVAPFNPSCITKSVLNQLLRQDIVFKLSRERSDFLLYQPGVPANYFTLILEGTLLVTIGEEGLQFEARGFYTFGSRALMEPYNDDPYLPDFTVSMGLVDCLVIIVTKRRYLAALKASRFENEQSLTVSAEVFSKEWVVAETSDLQASLAGKAGLTNITHLLKTKPLQGLSVTASPTEQSNATSSAGSPVEHIHSDTPSVAYSDAPLIHATDMVETTVSGYHSVTANNTTRTNNGASNVRTTDLTGRIMIRTSDRTIANSDITAKFESTV